MFLTPENPVYIRLGLHAHKFSLAFLSFWILYMVTGAMTHVNAYIIYKITEKVQDNPIVWSISGNSVPELSISHPEGF